MYFFHNQHADLQICLPALYRNEKRLGVDRHLVLFTLGAAMVYYVVTPMAWNLPHSRWPPMVR